MTRARLANVLTTPVIIFLGLFLFSVITYTAGLARVQSILWGDTRYYYTYTASLLLDRDINFSNQAYLPDVGFPHPPVVSQVTHLVTNKFSPGAPLLWTPGFLIGQTVTWLVYATGHWVRLDGYSSITQYSTALWAIGLSVSGLYVVFRVLRAEFGVAIAWWSVAFLYVATQMTYYTSIDPLNSHSASFLFSSLLLWSVWRVIRGSRSPSWSLLIGMIGGVLSLIRNQDAVLMIPIGVMLLFQPGRITSRLGNAIALTFGWVAIMSIQVLCTVILYGQLNSPYLIQGEQMMWLRPDFWRVLFTPQNGVLFFAPGLLLGIWGLWNGAKRHMLYRIALAGFLLELYVVAAWAPEILGGPYGSRMFVSSLPWLTLGFASALQAKNWHQDHRWRLLLVLGILAANTLAQTLYMLATY